MLELLNLKPKSFGLDISDLSLKIVKLKKRGRFLDLASLGQEKIKPGIIKEGEIKDEKKLAEIIKGAIKKVEGERLGTKYVVASLPEEKAFLQVIRMPRLSEEDLKSAIIFEAENYIPLPIEQVYLDFQIIPRADQSSDRIDVLLAALPKKIIDPYINSIKLAGLTPVAFEIESMAITRSLIKNQACPSPVLLIDLGATRTSFIIFSDCSLKFTSSIPVSSQHLSEIISKNLGVSVPDAEKLKMRWGLEEKIKLKIEGEKTEMKRERGKIFEALVPVLVDLIQQIKKHLDYYQTHASAEHLIGEDKKVSRILLCGGGANLKGLSELLTLELKIPVELGNPWVNILPDGRKETAKLTLEKSLSYATALGLALRGMEEMANNKRKND